MKTTKWPNIIRKAKGYYFNSVIYYAFYISRLEC